MIDIGKIAKLANIKLTAKEKLTFKKQLSNIINFVSHLETEKEKTLPNTISASDNLVSSLIENKKLFIETKNSI